MTIIQLKPKKDESLLRFHPWVFSGAINKILLDPHYPFDAPQEGDLVCVKSSEGRIMGVGHYQIGSIAVRMLEFFVSKLSENFWEQRITSAYNLRESVGLVSSENNTYRLIHGEGDFLPGLVIDVYANTAVIQAHSIGMHLQRLQIAEAVIKVVPGVENVYYKSDDTLPFKATIEGDRVGYLIQTQTIMPDEFWAKENNLYFRIDWLKGQKTGFFVDQRENRALLERYARGRDVLNMFCYSGGFSVYAMRGGAHLVHSVDVSEKAIALVRDNVHYNFPTQTNHEAYAQEAFSFMSNIRDKYDLIILDPPAFAKHRDAIHNALRGYQRINAKAIEQIRKGGILFTFSCSQAIDKDMFRRAVFSAAAQVGRKVRILHQLHQPQDHPINIYHPEGEYLKGLVLYVE